jgi:hypothetical protein
MRPTHPQLDWMKNKKFIIIIAVISDNKGKKRAV